MENILVGTSRKLNEEELLCRDRFVEWMQTYNYIPLPNEQFKLMLLKKGNYKVYNPYYFVSNYGNIISVAEKEIKMLKPYLKTGPKGSKTRWTDYIKENYNWQVDFDKGYVPQYYYTFNYYAKKHFGKNYKIPLHRLVAVYFLHNGNDALISDNHVHHIIPFDWNKPHYVSNVWTNLLILPDTVHDSMHGACCAVIVCLTDGVAETTTGTKYSVKILYDADGSRDYYATMLLGVADLQTLVFRYHLVDGKMVWLRCDKLDDKPREE